MHNNNNLKQHFFISMLLIQKSAVFRLFFYFFLIQPSNSWIAYSTLGGFSSGSFTFAPDFADI